MAEVDPSTVAPPVEGAPAANITFTFEEQVMTSCALYSMALLCIVIGAIRSAQCVQRHIKKNKLIEASITVSEARKFPITASCVLFGIYLFFKPDAKEWIVQMANTYLPEKIAAVASNFLGSSRENPEAPGKIAVLVTSLVEKLPMRAQELLTAGFGMLPTLSKDLVMKLLLVLLCFEGCIALASLMKPFFSFLLKLLPIGNHWPRFNSPYFLSLKKGKKEMEEGDIEDAKKTDIEYLLKLEVDTHDIIAILFCSFVGISHILNRHWITNNLIGIAFSIYGIENLHLSSFKAGTFLLCGLFVYDIFWVFATDVMTSVAKGIDAPILLRFPQDILRHGWMDANKFSMLGLGDIVIPGVFIALLRRFDYRIGEQGKKREGGNRYFFIITVFGYAVGLLLTMAVMHYFKAAQPALLYLVPCCLLIPLFVASLTGDLNALWNYNEEHLIEKHGVAQLDKKSAKKNN